MKELLNSNEETVVKNDAQQAEVQESKATGTGRKWKKIGVGAAGGILIGAGALYATKAYGADQNESEENKSETPAEGESGLKVADVSGAQTFDEAFKEARAEVGPGGVFHYKGGIYSTYTNEEWDKMTDAEKDEFSEAVKPEVRASEIHTVQHHDAAHSDAEPTITINGDVVILQDPEPTPDPTPDPEPTPDPTPNPLEGHEVEVVGETELELSEGNTATVELLSVDGHMGLQADLDHDSNIDVIAVDWNDDADFSMENGEVSVLNPDAVAETNSHADYAATDSNVDTAINNSATPDAIMMPDTTDSLTDNLMDTDSSTDDNLYATTDL